MVKPLQAKHIKKISEKEKAVTHKFNQKKQSVLERFPLLFTLLATFGVVSVFYGVEGIISRIEIFAENPVILLLFGLGLLIFTGSLYKKLG